MKKAEEKYNELIKRYQSLIADQVRVINLISSLRLLVFLMGTGLGIYLAVRKDYGLLLVDITIFLTLFIFLIIKHEHNIEHKKYLTILQDINENAVKRLHGEWQVFPDDGEEFSDDSHPYTQDLDIFGQGSLFQFINTASTYLGRQKLRELLSSPPTSINEITARQEAVTDLAAKLDWRQKFQAAGILASNMHDPQALFAWAGRVERLYLKPSLLLACRLLPVITIGIGIFTFLQTEPEYYVLIAALLLQFFLLKIKGKKRAKNLELAFRYTDNIKAYSRMLHSLETQKFDSSYLQGLQARLKGDTAHMAYEQIGKLVKIVDSISNRHNAFYIIFNILFLLDYQFMFMLEKWKERSGSHLRDWLSGIGELEALSSLALIRHDHPEWAMPEFTDADLPVFAAEELGHPLILSGVTNDLKFDKSENILLITGSNMSGKSTLLRTAGINLVLAYSGTAVCAKDFSCSLMDIYTCMRVSDNLEKNISSFYAELLRIKMMVQAVEEGKTVFFLLDEIFKGTNSADRHTGARTLIKKLSEAKVLGLISTHDLELGELAKESDKVKNYHFQEYYENDQIRFDYKLRPGVSATRNAIYLMRLAGIDIEK